MHFNVDNELQQRATSSRKRDPQEADERPPYPALHFGIGPNKINKAFDISDGDFNPYNTVPQNQDLTGEIPEPIGINRPVGPGDTSNQATEKGPRIVNNCSITRTIMSRRSSALRTGIAQRE